MYSKKKNEIVYNANCKKITLRAGSHTLKKKCIFFVVIFFALKIYIFDGRTHSQTGVFLLFSMSRVAQKYSN